MAIRTRKLIFYDLEAIPEERPGDRHELIDGELVVTPSCTPSVLGLVGARFEPIPFTEDRVIQSWILPQLRLTVEAVFEGIDELEKYRIARKSHGDNS